MFTRGDQRPPPVEPATWPALVGSLVLLLITSMVVGGALAALWMVTFAWVR